MDAIYLVVLQSSKKMADFADLDANVESCLAELESYFNMNVDLSEAARAHVHASFMQLRIKLLQVVAEVVEAREEEEDEEESVSDGEGHDEGNDVDFLHDEPRIGWNDDDGSATCLRCGVNWDGNAQHRC